MGEHIQRHENFLFTSKLASLQEFINVFEEMCQCCSSRNGNVVLLPKKKFSLSNLFQYNFEEALC